MNLVVLTVMLKGFHLVFLLVDERVDLMEHKKVESKVFPLALKKLASMMLAPKKLASMMLASMMLA